MWQLIEKADIDLFYLINRGGQNAFFDSVMPILSNFSYFFVPFVLLIICLLLKSDIKYRVVAISMLLLILSSDLLCDRVLKPAFNRPRPFHTVSNVHLYYRVTKTWSMTAELKEKVYGKSNSFPSGHATNIFAVAILLSVYFRRFWPLFYLIALFVGYSRVYLGAHFPLDVLAGGITGTLTGLLFIWFSSNVIRVFEHK
ncbi:MAG: phosphatase PAP2 family protein [Desulfobacterales bacterium]